MKKKHAIIISLLLFVACSSIIEKSDFRLPKHLGLGITHKIRTLASGEENAFMSKSYNTWDRLKLIENELLPLISTSNNFLFKKNSTPITVNDYLENKELNAQLPQKLFSIMQKMYLVKSQILWLVQDKMKKVGLVNYVGLDIDEKAKKSFGKASVSKLTKLQEDYLQILPGVYYLYALVAHLYDEKNHESFKNFGFSSLIGLNLITNKYFSKFLSNKTGLNMKRLTLPQNTRSLYAMNDSNFQVHFLKYIEEFQNGDNVLIKDHIKTYSNYYQTLQGSFSAAIKKYVHFDLSQELPDMVSYTMGPEDKILIEYLVLKKPKSPMQLAKVNQFLAIREMIVNSWAIQRITAKDKAKKISECGDGLLSFKLWNEEQSTDAIDYLHALWNQDLYLNTLGDFFNEVRELLYGDFLIASGISTKDKSDKEYEEMLDKATKEYQKVFVTLIKYPEKAGNVPRKLKEILSDPFFQEDLKGADNPIEAIADYFSAEDAMNLELKDISYNKIDFINSVFSRDNLSGSKISAILALDAYSVRKKNLVKYFMNHFVGGLELTKKYPAEDKEFYIVKKDVLAIEKYFNKMIDQNWGSKWILSMTSKIDQRLTPLLDNLYKQSYEKKFKSLNNFLTENIKHAILLTDYFAKNPRGKKKVGEKATFPKEYSLPVSSPTMIQSLIIKDQLFCKHGACWRIDNLLFHNQYFAQEIMSELMEIVQKKARDSEVFGKMLKEDLSLVKEYELTNEIWNILTATLLELKKRHPYTREKYQEVYSKYGDDNLYRNKIAQESTRVNIIIDPNLKAPDFNNVANVCSSDQAENCENKVSFSDSEKSQCNNEFLESKIRSEKCNTLLATSHVDSKKPTNKSVSEPDPKKTETVDFNFYDDRILEKGFQLYHIAEKFNFLDFNTNIGNQFMKSAKIQELLALIYIDKLLEVEPFFNTVVQEKTKEWGSNSQHTKVRDITFLKLFTKKVIGTKKIPPEKELRSIFSTVVKDAQYLGKNGEIQSFCNAKYSDHENDKDFDELFTKTKNIRERIIAQNPELNSVNEGMRWKIEPVRVVYEKAMLYVGVGFIVAMVVLGGLSAIGVPFVGGLFTNLLFIKFTSYFFLGVMVYELGYGLLYLPPQLDIQRSIVSAHNLRTSKSMDLENYYAIDTFDRIKKEHNQAKFDMAFALAFAITDIAALRLVYRQKLLAKGIPQSDHLSKISRSNRVKENIRQNREYYESLSKWQKRWHNFKKEYRWGNKTTLKVTKDELENITFDTLRHAVINSDIPYKTFDKVKFAGVENIDRRIKNLVHFIADVNKSLEVRFINAIKGKWGIFSKGDLKKQILSANEAITNIAAKAKKANPESIAEMKAAVKRLEDLKVPEKFEIRNREVSPEGHQFIDEYLMAMSDFFDVMFKNQKILPEDYVNKTIAKTYKDHAEMATMRIFSSESLELMGNVVRKNPDEIGKHFDEWMELVNRERKNVDGSIINTKKIVDEAITARSPGAFIFEMFLETSWNEAKIKWAKRMPDSFLASIFDDITRVREIKETTTSAYRKIYKKLEKRTERMNRITDQLILEDIQKI